MHIKDSTFVNEGRVRLSHDVAKYHRDLHRHPTARGRLCSARPPLTCPPSKAKTLAPREGRVACPESVRVRRSELQSCYLSGESQENDHQQVGPRVEETLLEKDHRRKSEALGPLPQSVVNFLNPACSAHRHDAPELNCMHAKRGLPSASPRF